jgi:protein ImuB
VTRSWPQTLQQIDAFATSPLPAQPRQPSGHPASHRLLDPVPGSSTAHGEASELWLGIHLPQLEETADQPLEPGEAHIRRRLLERLAMRAQGFTSRVSLAPPDGLLLEIKGSVGLFSGVENLCRLVMEGHRAMQVESVLAIAPTPLAALSRARAGQEPVIMDKALLISSIVSLPLSSLRWPSESVARLAKIGVYTVGQALRLPRAGFARRFGAAQLGSLDRLTGRAPHPLIRFVPRERFRRIRDLPYEIENHEPLLHAIRPMLQEMGAFLRARQAGITRLECRFRHRSVASTSIVLQLSAPAADAQHIEALFAERLAGIVLPEPARRCDLRTDVIMPLAQRCVPLWQPGEHGGAAAACESAQLIEHLRARLSAQAVHGLRTVSDHRPEKASCIVEPAMLSQTTTGNVRQVRPLWLFVMPQQLSERDGWPLYHGPLELGPLMRKERIEAASWDAQGIARDYYVAIDARGVQLWIFRERAAPHRWFLHGMFG